VAYLYDENEKALKYILWLSGGEGLPRVQAMILRKQAEAVEAIKDFKIVAYGSTGVAVDVYEILKYAQRLRNQSDEIEKAGGGHG